MIGELLAYHLGRSRGRLDQPRSEPEDWTPSDVAWSRVGLIFVLFLVAIVVVFS